MEFRKRTTDLVGVAGARTVYNKRMKLPLKKRFQVRTPVLPLPVLRMAGEDARMEEGGDSSDEVEIVPHNCVLTEVGSDDGMNYSSDDDAEEEVDEEKLASGYLADSEEEPGDRSAKKERRKRNVVMRATRRN